jgi:two-component system chemotaxis response regulator CheB
MAAPRSPAGNGSGVEERRIEVVALVTSAGGLEALLSVLRVLPADFPGAVVVAQHLGGQGSKLVEILTRRIALPVEWARDGCRIGPGLVTVCPPRMSLEVLPDLTCALHPAGNGGRDQPLSGLLTSLADSVGERAAGVVLTGMGRDGVGGAEALREAGGLVIAQSPDTAEQPAMPRAVAEAGAADLVLPPL